MGQDTLRLQFRPTDAQLLTLQKEYAGLDWQLGERELDLLVGVLTPEQKQKLMLDLAFLEKNQSLPLENICNRLDNYVPKNETQQKLLTWAQRLAGIDNLASAVGLYVYGPAGVGKTHISIALTKELMARGFEARYITEDGLWRIWPPNDCRAGQAWVIDDLNQGYGIGDRFRAVILNAATAGGVVFVTSNRPFEEVMREAVPENERPRLYSRMGNMFYVLQVLGEDQRKGTAWHEQFEDA